MLLGFYINNNEIFYKHQMASASFRGKVKLKTEHRKIRLNYFNSRIPKPSNLVWGLSQTGVESGKRIYSATFKIMEETCCSIFYPQQVAPTELCLYQFQMVLLSGRPYGTWSIYLMVYIYKARIDLENNRTLQRSVKTK